MKTTGTVVVAFFAAIEADAPAASKTSGFMDASSAAMARNRSGSSLGKRSSTVIVLPST
jgi:hypothetical protein